MIKIFTGIFAAINRSESDLSEYKQLYIQRLSNADINDFWKLFGYVFMGAFKAAGDKREELLQRLSDKSIYVQSIFKAAYYDTRDDISYNTDILIQVLEGMEEFVDETVVENLSILQDIIINYIDNDLDGYIKYRLLELYNIENINGSDYKIPVNRSGRMRFGIINPWPGDLSAESEVVIRTVKSADISGIEYVPLSDWGHILDEISQKKTENFVNSRDLDFIITTHYLTHKGLDAFYYHALWNPPEIPLNLPDYTSFISNNYLMNDDYLTYDMGGMKNHLRAILMNKPRDIEDTSMLTASFPEESMLEPNLDEPKLFYCGMNWDKLVNNQNRHEGLFKLLDDTGKVKFFGPDIMKNWGGIRPWDGYKCYQYPIPWDGFSILKEVNECGICLVISSDIHRRAGAVTNRAYEACAAGAVIISDNNEFMLKHFKDAALFIYYNRENPIDTYNQIMEKYEWIISHKEEAKELVKRAQAIFREKFALDKQLLRIVENHPKRFNTIKNDLFARDDSKKVLVTYVLNSLAEEDIKQKIDIVIKNVKHQYYRSIDLVIIADKSVYGHISDYVNKTLPTAFVESMALFDEKRVRYMTDGSAIRAAQKKYSYSYFVNTTAREIWFYDHITTLVRTIEDDNSYVAYSGRLFLDSDNNCTNTDFFDVYTDMQLSSLNDAKLAETSGQFMFLKEANNLIPDYVMDLLDGLEHYAYINILKIKHAKALSFSRRMSIVDNGYIYDNRRNILNYDMQSRVIKDAIRFELKQRSSGIEDYSAYMGDSLGDINTIVGDAFLNFPIKRWIKYRICTIMARILGYNSKLGYKFVLKAEKIKGTFLKR